MSSAKIYFRQLHRCQNGHGRMAVWYFDGFEWSMGWDPRATGCNCPTARMDQGFLPVGVLVPDSTMLDSWIRLYREGGGKNG